MKFIEFIERVYFNCLFIYLFFFLFYFEVSRIIAEKFTEFHYRDRYF